MKKILLLLLIGCLSFVKGQAPLKFYTRFGGNGHDIGYSVVQTLDGHYAVTGSTGSFGFGNTDVYLAKVDSTGWVRWQTSFGGFNNDVGRSIIQTADSGFVIGGYTNSMGNGGYDLYILKTDKNGALIWQKTFGGLDWEFGYCVKESSDGGFVICGTTQSFGYGKTDGYIIKVNANGVFQWQKIYGGVEDDEFKSFVFTYNNMIAFAGTTKSYGDVKGDGWVFKTDLNGDSSQCIVYNKTNKQFFNDIKEHPVSKNFYLCGGYDKDGKDSTAAILLCLTETGVYQFDDIYSYHEQADEQFVSNTHVKNNQFMYIRKSQNSNTDKKLQPMISYFDNNIYISSTKYGDLTADDELFNIITTRDSGIVAVGYTNGYNSALTDVFLLKLEKFNVFGAASFVGVNEIKQDQSNQTIVFPTLTKDFIFIKDLVHVNTVYIYDALGRQLREIKTNKSDLEIDFTPFLNGIYFISTVNGFGNSKTFKVIKTD